MSPENLSDNVLGVLFGEIAAYIAFSIGGWTLSIGEHAITALIVGILGGFGGMIGKEIWNLIKNYWKA